jgi:hypothetical protein
MIRSLTLLLGLLWAGEAWAQSPVEAPILGADTTQTLVLKPGRNLVSLWVKPPDSTMAAIFAPVREYIIMVMDDQGRVWSPRFEIYTLTYWDWRESYWVWIDE